MQDTPDSPGNTTGTTVQKVFTYNGFPIPFVIFMIFALAITLLLALVGNLLIILAIWKNVSGKMRSTRNLLILNMAISDLLSSVFNIPDQIRWLILGYQVLVDGRVGVIICLLKDFINTIAIDVSLFSLAFITIDRYFGVFFPMRKYFTRTLILTIIALSWLIPTVFYTPKFAIFNIVSDAEGQRICVMNVVSVFKDVPQYLHYMLAHFAIVQVLPVVLMMVLYPSIAWKLWSRKIPGITHERTRSRTIANNKKITMMFAIIILSSIFCYTPLYVSFYDCIYGRPIAICEWKYFNYYTSIAALLFFIPLCINCFIYAKFCESFKRAFKDIVKSFGSGPFCCEKRLFRSKSAYEMSEFGNISVRRRRLDEDLPRTEGTIGSYRLNCGFNPEGT
ncbi:predicted protein [Nematostella vectensis]|uniref:G-protein coupled receptors family 1 profile domain-containing protein n=1 Tax=Nematostella vectensis TaxID=45351 RepID=A7T171_NEMVE|nr:predicted protein [Nematostella vectensis]|eukprot:XP_001622400.1 hypothetical protein NEMVEDRAFT_v1g220776 [Nematostella vectensis]